MTRHRVRIWLASLCLGGPTAALGADLEVGAVEQNIDALWVRAQGLRQQVDPAASTREMDADERFDKALLDRLLSRWEDAASGFWLLDRADAFVGEPRRAEVQWYLAECLDQAGYAGLAADAYRVMTNDPGHPFREEAVPRLLALHLSSGDARAFDRLYQREVVQGALRIDDRTRFLIGRLLFQQGQRDEAVSYFEQVPVGSRYWAKATYHLGALAVDEGSVESLDRALQHFSALTSPEAAERVPRHLVDLAWLGIARIHQARDELRAALGAYGEVDQGSDHRVTQLYEMVWAFARAGQWRFAKNAVELFVLTYPDHPWVSEMRLTRAHLAYRDGREDDALEEYTDVVEQLEPLAARFASLLESRAETATTLSAIAAGDGPVAAALPEEAVALVRNDTNFSRAVGLNAELQAEDEAITRAEASSARLAEALGGGATVGSDEVLEIRRGVVASVDAGMRARIDVLNAELSWLSDMDGSPEALEGLRSEVDRVASSVIEALEPLRGVDGMSGEQLLSAERAAGQREVEDERLRALAGRLRLARGQLGVDLRFDPASARVDGLHRRLDGVMDGLWSIADDAPGLSRSAISDLIDEYRTQAREVERQRRAWMSMSTDVRDVAVQAGQLAFASARDQVDDTIMGAEMGLVNIFWSRWVDMGEETRRVKNERNALIEALESRYGLLQQKLGR